MFLGIRSYDIDPRPGQYIYRRIALYSGLYSQASKSQSSAIAGPSIQGQKLSPPLVLLAEIFRHSAADLGESTSHYSAKVALELLLVISQ